MSPETAAAVMAERESVLALLFVERAKPTSQERAARWALDDLAKAIRARPAPVVEPAGDGWQPIETAPKDGTPVLVAVRAKHGWYIDAAVNFWLEGGEDIWQARESAECIGPASYWRPLPDPPALADLQRAEG